LVKSSLAQLQRSKVDGSLLGDDKADQVSASRLSPLQRFRVLSGGLNSTLVNGGRSQIMNVLQQLSRSLSCLNADSTQQRTSKRQPISNFALLLIVVQKQGFKGDAKVDRPICK
jgi:hypothetical protein